jgi:hypothetical protein
MGMTSDHWKLEYEGHKVEIEVYMAGFASAACSLFVDDERIDHVPSFGSFPTQLTLRYKSTNGDASTTFIVEIKQGFFGTKANLIVNGKEVNFPRIR